VDEKHEVITSTKVTPGMVDDAHLLEEMIQSHEQNTKKSVDTAVADSKYGTMDNFLVCHDKDIKAHIPSLEETHRGSGRRKGIFHKEDFTYNPDNDTFTCPAGQVLKRRNYYKKRNHFEYKASAELCATCSLRDKCTRSKNGRTLKRHVRQDDLDKMLQTAKSKKAKADLKTRQHLSERSFATSTRYGFKRARWRRLWRMEIQDFLTAAIQNIVALISQPKHKISKSHVQTVRIEDYRKRKGGKVFLKSLINMVFGLYDLLFTRFEKPPNYHLKPAVHDIH
jgi:hypothetical protein